MRPFDSYTVKGFHVLVPTTETRERWNRRDRQANPQDIPGGCRKYPGTLFRDLLEEATPPSPGKPGSYRECYPNPTRKPTMNILSRILHRLFPSDGQLRIAVFEDGHAQIQEYCGLAEKWLTYRQINTVDNGCRYTTEHYYSSFDEAKQAYDALINDRSKLRKCRSIVKTYP